MTKYFADVSSFQRDDLGFFQGLVNAGVASVLIKTTQGSSDGDNYNNPKANRQVLNALQAGMNVGFYHYF
ncbi:glycoside hydrolase family 25 protein, partial [Bacillus velezensis]|uniref:glycoside hydrolase family 25 protein n=1 Tax=Bacillus velezensis TaxID=492670 RepID=UPI0013B8EA1A